MFGGHLLYARCCVRNWRISRNKTTDTTPVIREIFKTYGEEKALSQEAIFLPISDLSHGNGREEEVERFMELKVPSVMGFGLERP